MIDEHFQNLHTFIFYKIPKYSYNNILYDYKCKNNPTINIMYNYIFNAYISVKYFGTYKHTKIATN